MLVTFTTANTAGATTTCDAVCTRVRGELAGFTGWLRDNGVKGYIGEVGWPSTDTRWGPVAERWYTDADQAGLWATAWATGEWWGTTYPLSAYVDRLAPAGLDTIRPQGVIVDRHPTSFSANRMRGVNLAGAEFGTPVDQATSTFSDRTPGVYGVDWHYDGVATFAYLALHGVKVVRLPFRWERLQPNLSQPFDAAELGRLTSTVDAAQAAGISVILDVHNYAGYYRWDGTKGVRRALGSAELTKADFVDLWRRLSVAFKGRPGVAGYGLMNEPIGIAPAAGLTPARRWEIISQAAVDAIRANGDTTTVLVAGYEWSGVVQWTRNHPKPWITDPAGNVRYEAHHYFDGDHSGRYVRSYDQELAAS